MLVGIESGERLAEGLADAIAGIRTHRVVGADAPLTRVEADGVVRRGEHHALDAAQPRRLEQVVAANDVGLQDLLPRALGREAAEMDDPLRAIHGALDLAHDGEVRLDEGLVCGEVRGHDAVAPANGGIGGRKELAQLRANAACRSGNDDRFHVAPRRYIRARYLPTLDASF